MHAATDAFNSLTHQCFQIRLVLWCDGICSTNDDGIFHLRRQQFCNYRRNRFLTGAELSFLCIAPLTFHIARVIWAIIRTVIRHGKRGIDFRGIHDIGRLGVVTGRLGRDFYGICAGGQGLWIKNLRIGSIGQRTIAIGKQVCLNIGLPFFIQQKGNALRRVSFCILGGHCVADRGGRLCLALQNKLRAALVKLYHPP